jgi:hypothetical protein
MAEDVLKTGKFTLGRDRASGRLVAKYEDEDPDAGLRAEGDWADLDSIVQEFFGYKDWEEYKKDNQQDLKKEKKTDKDGKIVQAPTIHPIHVAYAFDEFKKSVSADQYTLVGIPNTSIASKLPEQDRARIREIEAMVEARKKYLARGGFLDQKLRNPQEGLVNKKIIDRIKNQFDLKSTYESILTSPMQVMHPRTKEVIASTGVPVFWTKSPDNYNDLTLNQASDRKLPLTDIPVNIQPETTPGVDALSNTQMLEQQTVPKKLADRSKLDSPTINDPRAARTQDIRKKKTGTSSTWGAATQKARDAEEDVAASDKAAQQRQGTLSIEDPMVRLEVEQAKLLNDTGWTLVKILDPSGVSSWGDWWESVQEFNKNPSAGAGFDTFLNTIAIIPAWGILAKGLRVAGAGAKVSKAALKGGGRAAGAATAEAQTVNKLLDDVARQADDYIARVGSNYKVTFKLDAVKNVVDDALQTLRRATKQATAKMAGDAFDEIAYVTKLKTLQGELVTVSKNLGKMANRVGEGPARDYIIAQRKAANAQIAAITNKIADAPALGQRLKAVSLNKAVKADLQASIKSKNLDEFKKAIEATGDASLNKTVKNLKNLDDADWGVIAKIADDIKVKDPSALARANEAFKKWLAGTKVGRAARAGKAALKTGAAQAAARLVQQQRKKEQRMTPDVPLNAGDIRVVLLPLDWYKSPENFITTQERLVGQRVKINMRGMNVPVLRKEKPGVKDTVAAQNIPLPAAQGNLTPQQTRKLQNDVYTKKQLADNPELPAPKVPYAFIESKLGIPASAWDTYRDELARLESGGDYSKKGGAGGRYDGRYQIGKAAKTGGARAIGIEDPGHGKQERVEFRESPDLQEQILAGLTVGNHNILTRTSRTDRYREITDPIQKLIILAYAHNQGAGAATKWLSTGVSSADQFKTDGTEFSNAIAAALSPNEKVSLQEMKAIVFGHSQAGRFGETLKSKIESQGGEIFPKNKGVRVNSAKSDQQLAELIKNISPDEGPFTHAYLFLGGNSAVPGTKRGEVVDQAKYNRYVQSEPREGYPDFSTAKQEIVNYVTNVLRVPKENILITLPPINKDDAYSNSRRVINRKAEDIFGALGVTVNPQVVGSKKNFARDGVHILAGSGLERRTSYNMLRRYSDNVDEFAGKGSRKRSPASIRRLNKKLAGQLGWSTEDFGATKFDDLLTKNIKKFQKENKLEVDGIAGDDTFGALSRIYGPPQSSGNVVQTEPAAPENPKDAQRVSSAGKRARMRRFKAQYGDFYDEEQLRQLIADAESKNVDPGQYIRGLITQSTNRDEQALRVADPDGLLQRFDSTGNVVVLDPRKGYAMPEIIPWLRGLANVDDGGWVIGDISLPLGGYPWNYPKGSVFRGTNRRVRFNHTAHQTGYEFDINLPLKGGKTNAWNQDITDPNLLDEEKLISFLKYFASSPLAAMTLLNPAHVSHMRKYARAKYGKGSEEYKVTQYPILHKYKAHLDHLHVKFKPTVSATKLKLARAKFKKVFRRPQAIAENKILEFLFKFTDEVENELV